MCLQPSRIWYISFNVMGSNNLENITIIINRCSCGVQWHYYSPYDIAVREDDKVFININNISLIGGCVYSSDRKRFDIILNYFCVFLAITNSNFSKWKGGKNINIEISSSKNTVIYFDKCNFVSNNVTNELIRVDYFVDCYIDQHPEIDVTFDETVFSNANDGDHYEAYDISLLTFNKVSKCFHNQTKIIIKFKNVTFYRNQQILLETSTEYSSSHDHSFIVISTEGYFVIKENHSQKVLPSLKFSQMHFNGITKFIGNAVLMEIVYLSSSKLSFSNKTLFADNSCNYVIHLSCEKCYLVLQGSANITLFYNRIANELIYVPIRTNYPYPYCLFQYYSITKNQYSNFQINLVFNLGSQHSTIWKYGTGLQYTIHRLISHCKWAPGTTFQDETPLAVNNKIIHIKEYKYSQSITKLGDHTTVCHCPLSSHYNCSVDQLGPVYPGENLTVDLCLPYNDEKVGIMYVETYNDNLPESACKIYERGSMRHMFHGNQSRTVHFPIASDYLNICELFVTAQPNLFTLYDAFYVHLLPCPLGFTLQHGICDCDPDLRKYIGECMISSQTVARFPNIYILGIDSINSNTHYYRVSTDCPIYYCLKDTTRIDLRYPDTQCQPHRTGLLCSQCMEGYSIVFGSRKCKKMF